MTFGVGTTSSNAGPAVTTSSTLTDTPLTSGGYVMGQSTTDLIAFYGATPVAQQAKTVDLVTQLVTLGLVPAGTVIQGSGAPVVITAAGSVTAAANAGRVNVLNNAAGFATALPAATGSGARYDFIIGATVTSVGMTITPAGSDKFYGQAIQGGSAGAATVFNAAAAGTAITLNGSTTGGFIGDKVVLIDYATAAWDVVVTSKITGTAATPFS